MLHRKSPNFRNQFRGLCCFATKLRIYFLLVHSITLHTKLHTTQVHSYTMQQHSQSKVIHRSWLHKLQYKFGQCHKFCLWLFWHTGDTLEVYTAIKYQVIRIVPSNLTNNYPPFTVRYHIKSDDILHFAWDLRNNDNISSLWIFYCITCKLKGSVIV